MDLLYPRAVAALNDDFETVRLEAIKLLWFDIPFYTLLV